MKERHGRERKEQREDDLVDPDHVNFKENGEYGGQHHDAEQRVAICLQKYRDSKKKEGKK